MYLFIIISFRDVLDGIYQLHQYRITEYMEIFVKIYFWERFKVCHDLSLCIYI